jgi:hypothetical protein
MVAKDKVTQQVSLAITELRGGQHPLGYLATAQISLAQHARLYLSDPVYRNDVNCAIIYCLAHWKSFTGRQLGHQNKDTNNQSAKELYDALCASQARDNDVSAYSSSFSKKTDWTALFRHIDDIEHYAYKLAPDIATMRRESELDILDSEQTNQFEIGFV